MKVSLKSGLLAVGVLAASTAVYAAGNYSTLPIVGSASFCVSTVGVNGQQSATGTGGGAAGTAGAYCAQTVPAGPSILTGSELIPADTGLASGAPPQTVTVPMASLNALPITVSTVVSSAITALTATNLTGGIILHSTGTISQVSITLPATPIDGQQFAVSADQTVTALSMLTASTATAGQTVTKTPTALTSSTTATYGYRFMYNAAGNNWYRLL